MERAALFTVFVADLLFSLQIGFVITSIDMFYDRKKSKERKYRLHLQ